jgi:hypothetical protein
MTRRPLLAALVALAAAGCAPFGGTQPGTERVPESPSPQVIAPAGVDNTAVTPAPAAPSMPATRPTLPAGDPHAPMPGPGTCHLGVTNGQPVPDPTCTPAAVNPAVTQATIGQTICVSGWTKTVRPPTSVTNSMKRKLAVAYAMPPTGELDHLVSLELGGAPDDPRNLWVEPGSIPNPKDRVENWLKREVCAGRMTLADAQVGIAGDWTRYLGAAGGAPASEEN